MGPHSRRGHPCLGPDAIVSCWEDAALALISSISAHDACRSPHPGGQGGPLPYGHWDMFIPAVLFQNLSRPPGDLRRSTLPTLFSPWLRQTYNNQTSTAARPTRPAVPHISALQCSQSCTVRLESDAIGVRLAGCTSWIGAQPGPVQPRPELRRRRVQSGSRDPLWWLTDRSSCGPGAFTSTLSVVHWGRYHRMHQACLGRTTKEWGGEANQKRCLQ